MQFAQTSRTNQKLQKSMSLPTLQAERKNEKRAYELKDEPFGLDALKVAEKQMKYYKTNKKTAQ